MSSKKHPEYKQEEARLELTKEYIEKTLDATEAYKKTYKDNIKEAMIELDYLDSSQSYINILINSKFMEMAEKNYESLTRSRNKPYFARIDFKHKGIKYSEGNNKTEALYIGKTSLFKAEDGTPLIIDWRSPIANVYYEGRIGETSYEAEGKTQEGALLLKRQFTIEDGKLHDILDIDITTNDTFLQASLEANAEERLKDIASTIQAEQNRVIRADMGKPLIVQGVAGSGKTTIALHRIAYFIYTYEQTFMPENLMIMAPNRLFINYISEVLPELGVERVKQTTFIDFMVELLGNKYKMIDADAKLIELIHGGADEASRTITDLIKWSAKFKGSIDFKKIIDRYMKDIETQFIPKGDFLLGEHIIMTEDELRSAFLGNLKYLPVYKRVIQIKNTLANLVKQKKQDILKDIEEQYDQKICRLRAKAEDTEKRRLKIVSLLDKKDEKLAAVNKEAKTVVKKYIDTLPKVDLFDYYKTLMHSESMILKYSSSELLKDEVAYLCTYTTALLDKKKIELEDYAPLAYMKAKLFGFDEDITVKGAVIDEAQDFSTFQFYVLKEILNTNIFTLLGDISQGIHSYRGITDWEDVQEQVFGIDNCNYLTLVQSYRTTIEVMELANEVIKKLENPLIVLAKPVIRHGIKPEIRSFVNQETLLSTMQESLLQVQKENFKSIALICKTKQECTLVKKFLDKQKKIDATILDEKQENYEAGIIIVPSYLAKGLEFDVAVIVNIEEAYTKQELDIKLLYVAITRALHRLYIYYVEGKMTILEAKKE